MQVSSLSVAKQDLRTTARKATGRAVLTDDVLHVVNLAKENGVGIEVVPLFTQGHGFEHVQVLGLPDGVLRDVAGTVSGISLYGGFLRLLGAGGHRYCSESIASFSEKVFGVDQTDGSLLCGLVIATDVLGGIFAINNGTIALDPLLNTSLPEVCTGKVCYYCPESLQWDNLGVSYGQFLVWCTTHQWTSFYGPLLWLGWESDVAALTCDQALKTEPMLYKKMVAQAKGRKKRPVQSVALSVELLMLGEQIWNRQAEAAGLRVMETPAEDHRFGNGEDVLERTDVFEGPRPEGGEFTPATGVVQQPERKDLHSRESLGSYADSEDLESLSRSTRSRRALSITPHQVVI